MRMCFFIQTIYIILRQTPFLTSKQTHPGSNGKKTETQWFPFFNVSPFFLLFKDDPSCRKIYFPFLAASYCLPSNSSQWNELFYCLRRHHVAYLCITNSPHLYINERFLKSVSLIGSDWYVILFLFFAQLLIISFTLSLIEPTSFTQKKNSANWNARNQLSMLQRPEAFVDWERLKKNSVRFARKIYCCACVGANFGRVFFFLFPLTRSFPIHKSRSDLSFSAF